MERISSLGKLAAVVAMGCAGITAGSIAHGFSIGLQSVHGQWVCAEGGGGQEVVADRGAMGAWERFEVVLLADTLFESGVEIGLRASDGRFLCAENGGGLDLVANRTALGGWETFRIHRLDGPGLISNGDVVYLQAKDNGQYWCAEGGGGDVVNVNRTAVGAWEKFTITIDGETDKSEHSVWIDINGDGIRDEIIRLGAMNFNLTVNSWSTYCYDYQSYPVSSYFLPWGYSWGSYWPETPGFSAIWAPDLFWMFMSSYSYCDTYIEPALQFETTAGQRYRVYEDNSGSDIFNPANWTQVFSSDSFGTGLQNISLGTYDASYLYLGQFFLVRLGGPPVGVAPENDYTWRWEEIPGYPAGRTWDGVTPDADFPQWNWQNWPNTWWMTDPEDDDPELEQYFGSGRQAREAFQKAMQINALAGLQDLRRLKGLSRLAIAGELASGPIGVSIFVAGAIIELTEHITFSYVDYEKKQNGTESVYSGQTMGIGTPEEVKNRREATHKKLNLQSNFAGAEINASITTQGFRLYAFAAMEGREQQLIDYHGGAITDPERPRLGRTRAWNEKRATAVDSVIGKSLWLTSNDAFGQIFTFTGSNQYGFIVLPPKSPQWTIFVRNPFYWPN